MLCVLRHITETVLHRRMKRENSNILVAGILFILVVVGLFLILVI